ncbi:recombinase family protein [Methylobacterium sp. CM6247]
MTTPRARAVASQWGSRRASTSPPARVYGYVRSRELRARHASDQIEPQRLALDAWAASAGIIFDEVYVERGFGADCPLFKRTQGKAALARLQPNDVLVAARFDRLFGAAEDAHASLALARQQKFAICALDVHGGQSGLETDESLATILMALAGGTKYAVSLERKAAKNRQSELGRYKGGRVPFGYLVNSEGGLVPDPAQQDFLTQLHRMKLSNATGEQMRQAALEQGFSLTAAGIGKILKRCFSGR